MVERNFTDEPTFYENRPLEKVFCNCNARVLDFFVLNRGFDYSASEIGNITNIPLRSVQRSLPHLVKCGLIKEVNKIGKSKMYLLDETSELAHALTQYVDTSINMEIKNAKKTELNSEAKRVISLKTT